MIVLRVTAYLNYLLGLSQYYELHDNRCRLASANFMMSVNSPRPALWVEVFTADGVSF